MDIVISFDDTGSMSSVRAQVRVNLKKLVDELFQLDNELRIGIIIHNDYCDKDTIQLMDLTSNREEISTFIERTSSRGGGDSDECYELVLNKFHSAFSWKSSKKIGLIIGDCNPHEVGYKYGSIVNMLDWEEEAKKCLANDIKIFPIQALNHYGTYFYSKLATLTGNPKLRLEQFSHITQFITAVMYHEVGKLDDYENSNEQFKTNISLKRMFDTLKGLLPAEEDVWERSSSSSSSKYSRRRSKVSDIDYGDGDSEKTLDLASRFQILEVGETHRVIREFVETNGAIFKTGRGFYQFTKYEKEIQPSKEVLFVNKKTGEVKADTIWCRNQLKVPFGTYGSLSPKNVSDILSEYDVFIQSTSYTRKLEPNTLFLYELEYK